MATSEIKVNIKVSWWFRYLYLPLLKLSLSIMLKFDDTYQPNKERLDFWIKKAIRVEV